MIHNLDSLAAQLESVKVPMLRPGLIRTRALARKNNVRKRSIVAAILLSLILPALGFAAARYTQVGVTHRFGNWQVYTKTSVLNLRPTQQSLNQVALRAPYHIIWPRALPAGMKLALLYSGDNEIVVLSYRCAPKGVTNVFILPFNFNAVNARLEDWLASQRLTTWREDQRTNKPIITQQWTVGEQRVRLQSNCLSEGDVARIRTAMMNAAR